MISFIKALLRPDSPLVIVAVLAVVVVWWWRRPASARPRRLLVAFLAIFYLAATPIGAGILTASLAHGMPRLETREQARGADAVVVLGGGMQTAKAGDMILSQLVSTAALRILEGARVYKLIDARFVIVSGGIADEHVELRPEAEQMATALVTLGVPADRVLMDTHAKTTHEHPEGVQPLLLAHHITQFVVVTSPTHMRRAMAVFHHAGYDPVPSVSLLQSQHVKPAPFFMPNDDSMLLSNQALYEYGGFALYWWRGWLK
jgi:uncharacterized SAM-binding protein YcdF (DUF218 family)